MHINQVSQEDYRRFYVAKPDAGFSEQRNRDIIERTIKKTEENYKRKIKERNEGIGERSEVLGSYIRHLVNKNDSTTIEKYIGSSYLAQLRGEQKLARIKQLATQQGYL